MFDAGGRLRYTLDDKSRSRQGNPSGDPGVWLDSAHEGPGMAFDGLRGCVSDVRDGNTIEVRGVAVRIADLDCAERSTRAGQAASAAMCDLVAKQEVTCALERRQSHDREVGACALGGMGERLIANGACERWRP